MIATAVIGTVLFIYAGIMILKSIRDVHQALKGNGCAGCDMSCQKENIVKVIHFN